MDDEIRLKNTFSNALGLAVEKIDDSLEISSSNEWDSVAHISLITGIEDEFEIELEDGDLFSMNSYTVTKEILQKYGIVF